MRTSLFVLVTGASLLLSAGAFAEQSQPAALTQTASVTKDTVLCYRVYHQGTVVGGVQCHTKRWWDLNRFRQQQAVTDLQMRGAMKSPF